MRACVRVLPYCLDFLTGYYNKPSKRCCDHIYKLNRLAKRGLGAQMICWCIEYMVRGTEPRIRADRISELPTKCQTHLRLYKRLKIWGSITGQLALLIEKHKL
ncbi:hypothetical protein NC653_038862 [Populus alba x Populus x berolinensis]|uniref:Bifunctional inhibitor/plant lipid transfer protein/seed storage helical domain-containing protein n=1 Tax=Populus alba x Populus x berolinensis TaxID=444605 RepID=A0AAD6PTQ5_9ROSI|nr:hypothetical protein NC653_038862 [Populus alba x Populus x berolinensis]